MKYSTKLLATASLSVLMALPVTTANAKIDEMVVTSRKREENLQDIPLSVSAFSGEMLAKENLNSIRELAAYVPGFEMDQSFQRGFERPVLRGKSVILTGGDLGASFFINDVFFGGSVSSIDLSEVERIEIIKGPQSALFGRNTYSGAINIITKLPGDEFTGNATVQIAQHDQKEFTAGLSGPIIDGKLSGGVYVRHYQYGSEFKNIYDGTTVGEEESQSIAATLRFTPTDNLEFVARGIFEKIDDGPIAVAMHPFELNNYAERLDGTFDYFQGELTNTPINYNNADAELINRDGGFEQEHRGGSLQMTWDISDSFTLTSVTGYDQYQTLHLQDIGYEPGPGASIITFALGPALDLSSYGAGVIELVPPTADDVLQQNFMQDLRLEFDNGGRVRALGGLYYFYDKSKADFIFDPDGLQNPENEAFLAEATQKAIDAQVAIACAAVPGCDPTTGSAANFSAGTTIDDYPDLRSTGYRSTENIAIYGRLEFDITEQLTAGIEARYAEDRKKVDSIAIGEDSRAFAADNKFSSLTPRLTVNYQVSDENLVYGIVANGTKPGDFNSGSAAVEVGLTDYDEESIWSYEIGSKNTFLDGQLQLNVAGFYEEISDYQLTSVVTPDIASGVSPGTAIDNKGEVEIKGLEIDAIFAPEAVEGLSLRISYGYTESEIIEGLDQREGQLADVLDDGDRNCSLGIHDPNGDGLACLIGTFHNAAEASIAGHRLPLSAEHQLSAGFDYRGPLGAMGNGDVDWFIGANASYESDKFVQVQNLAVIPESTVVNFNVGIANENFKLTLWGKNIFDEDAIASGTRYFSSQNFFRRAFVTRPRKGDQWGVTLNANF